MFTSPKLGSFLCLILTLSIAKAASIEAVSVRGTVVDDGTGGLQPSRLYIQSAGGEWFFAKSEHPDGSAVEYRKRSGPTSVEMHTTLSAHPFLADLPQGRYTVTVERGKEYQPWVRTIDVSTEPVSLEIKLRRCIDMSRLGWFSGETHTHRLLSELPNVMLAEDLNVALPLTYWVTKSHTPPAQGDRNAKPVQPKLIHVDATHVIYPMNTEYEIFTVGDQRHTLGAVFALNHQSVLNTGVPPVVPIAERVHAEGGLLELDKHNWPWSMMLVPTMNVDLYELSNNHIWRTDFLFRQFGITPPDYMKVEKDEQGVTERGWIDFTIQNYYALLNCGLRLRPTAGTASGVHPVPLGFGRVYVHLPGGFSYEAWMKGLNAGNSFVTTGPLLDVRFNEKLPGTQFDHQGETPLKMNVKGAVRSLHPLEQLEVVSAGQVVRRIQPQNNKAAGDSFETRFDEAVEIAGSSWIAIRCFERQSTGRTRFAHTAPVHVDVAGKPLNPSREEAKYLIERVESELARNSQILSEAALLEYKQALAFYRKIAKNAK